MGFPVLLKATSGDLGATGGVVILAVTLTRAPLLVPLTAMQGNLIAHFVDQRTERLRALVGPAVVVTGLGLLGVLLAGVFGPWLLREAFGARVSGRRRAAGLADRGGGRDRIIDLDGRRGGRGGAASRIFGGLGVRDGGVGALAAAAAGPGNAHGDRTAVRAAGRNCGAPGRACQNVAWVTLYFVCIDTRYRDVWIVVPAFNEASVIGDVISDVRSVFDHVVCVDDGSRDDTGDVALRAGAHAVRHPVNLGQGAAIQTGVEYARQQPGAAVFATFDADGQHRVKDVVRMIDRLSAEDVDLVVGTRFADPGVVSHTPLVKRLVLRSAAVLSRRSRTLGLTDAHNGLRVFNKKVADGLNLTMSGMSHADEFIALACENHWRVTEEPVEILYTEYSMSKGQPLLNGVNIIFDGWLRGRMSR